MVAIRRPVGLAARVRIRPAAEPAPGRPRLVLAPDSFKGTLTASEAAAAMAAGAARALPAAELVRLPVADGGEGTVDALVAAGMTERAVVVRDAFGQPVPARFAVAGDRAVIEAAQACGLHRSPGTPDAALRSSSVGVGDLLLAAVQVGCRQLVVGLGGTSCTDGGAGMARALGVRMLDRDGAELPYGGGALGRLAMLDPSGLDPRPRERAVLIACDVTNPLLGPDGAAAVFGPQKGAGPAEVARLAAGLARYAELVRQACGLDVATLPGGGAAGGLGAGLVAFAGGEVVSGIDFMLREQGFADRLRGATLVLTGEGCLDRQSSAGKAPAGVARLARAHGVPVLAIAGRVEVAAAELGLAGAYSLTELAGAGRAVSDPAGALAEVTERVLRDWMPEADAR